MIEGVDDAADADASPHAAISTPGAGRVALRRPPLSRFAMLGWIESGVTEDTVERREACRYFAVCSRSAIVPAE